MMSTAYLQQKFAAFRQFESSLSPAQRQFLQQHPDLLSSDLVNQFVRKSIEEAKIADGVANRIVSLQEPEPKRKQARKVVNSFMTFRSYYSSLMKDLPQKNRSPMLSMLWKQDPDKALWQLLSEGFSHVRDNHPGDAVTMDKFLAVAAQVVPIIPPDQYFSRCGWMRNGDTLTRVEGGQREPPKATNVSAAGLVRYCFRTGLITKLPVPDNGVCKTATGVANRHSRISLVAAAQKSPLVALSPSVSESAYEESPSTMSSSELQNQNQDLERYQQQILQAGLWRQSFWEETDVGAYDIDRSQSEGDVCDHSFTQAADGVGVFDMGESLKDSSPFATSELLGMANDFWLAEI